MSLHISLVHSDRVEILTDGAVYDEAGILIATRRKITPVAGVSAAITTRGYVGMGDRLTNIVLGLFTGGAGFDQAADLLDAELVTLRDHAGSAPPVELLMGGISESRGATVLYFHNVAESNLAPFQVHWSQRGFLGNMELPEAQHLAGLRGGGLQRHGVALMEGQRKIASPSHLASGSMGQLGYSVGGHIDLTTISRAGVSTDQIHTWADKIGEADRPLRWIGKRGRDEPPAAPRD